MAEYGPPVVIQNGSTTIKAGFAGDEAPTALLRRSPSKDKSIQADLSAHQGNYSQRRPIECGRISNWDVIEHLWWRALNDKLLVPASRQPLLLTETVINPKAWRQKTTQIVFESLEAPGLYLAIPSVLSLYTSGSLTGIGLSCGGGTTSLVPVYEGIALRRGAPYLPFAGQELDQYLRHMLHQRGYQVDSIVARQIKEKLCYVATDSLSEEEERRSSDVSRTYELPDGQVINICQERYMVPEALFNSDFLGLPRFRSFLGAHDLISRNLDGSIQSQLYGNVVLSGGSCRFPGLSKRLTKEFEEMNGGTSVVNVVSAPDPVYSAWVGGSILASLSSFWDMMMTAQEYDEHGPSLVNRKCF